MAESKHDPQAEQRKKTWMAAAILLVPFIGCMYLIFGGSGQDDRAPGEGSFNMTVPDGRSPGIEASKQKALEREQIERQQAQHSLSSGNEFSLLSDSPAVSAPSQEESAVSRSQAAHQEAAQVMKNFYSAPKSDPQVEELKKQVEELTRQLESRPQETPDPLKLAEEQYKLARKYLGGGGAEDPVPDDRRKNIRVSVMRPVREGEVEASTLNPAADFTKERNLGFLTAAGCSTPRDAETVRACVARTQVVRVGSIVQLRLQDAVRIDGVTIPRNTPIYGAVSIGGDRLRVTVSSVEYEGRIFAVEASAYDLDGQPGLNVPNSRERTALKEALASVGQTAGTSVNVTRSAGQQVLSELARGGLQASSQYVAEKLREVKVTLKANHQVLLIQKE